MEDGKTRVTNVLAPVIMSGVDQACVVLIYPPGADLGKRFQLELIEAVVGRGADCDIQVDRDSVSRRHAKFERQGPSWRVVDQGSTNGTFVNDVQVKSRLLEHGDQIKIGSTIFKFLTGGSVETAYHEEIYRMTIVDGLTRAYNKRYFLEHIERELARTGRSRRPLSLVMFDIDHFKTINDTYGHLTGDHVLKELAARIRARVRKDELFARYGGEEFVVLLPEAGPQAAIDFAEQVRRLVERQAFEFDGSTIAVTISCGVATVTEERPEEEFIKVADENLYKAKHGGRNRVIG